MRFSVSETEVSSRNSDEDVGFKVINLDTERVKATL